MIFIGWMVLITSLSLFSFSNDTEERIWFPHLDKIVHFSFHFGILILGYLFLTERTKNSWGLRKRIGLLILFSFGYGLLIEGLQWLMPFGRSAEYCDVLANLSGAVMGGLLIQTNRSRIDRLN